MLPAGAHHWTLADRQEIVQHQFCEVVEAWRADAQVVQLDPFPPGRYREYEDSLIIALKQQQHHMSRIESCQSCACPSPCVFNAQLPTGLLVPLATMLLLVPTCFGTILSSFCTCTCIGLSALIAYQVTVSWGSCIVASHLSGSTCSSAI